jgi:hypothetical protein
MMESASISSVTRMTPSCAVIADPERPATQHGHEHRAKLPDDADAEQVDDIHVGTEAVELQC